MGNTQSKDDGAGGGGAPFDPTAGDTSRLKRFHTGASTDSSGFQSVAHPSLRRLSTTATGSAWHERRRPSQASQGSGGNDTSSLKSDTTPSASTFLRAASSERRTSASASNSPRASEREQQWVRNVLSSTGGGSGESASSRTPTTSPNRQRTRSGSIGNFLSGGSGGSGGSGARRQPSAGSTTTTTAGGSNKRSEFTFRRKKSIELSDMDHSLTFSGGERPKSGVPERQTSQDSTSLLSPVTDASHNSTDLPHGGRLRQASSSPLDDAMSDERSQSESTTLDGYNPMFPSDAAEAAHSSTGDNQSRDPLGRLHPTALPSYLKIPTLIPSAYASPTSSLPSSPRGVEARTSIDGGQDDDTASILSSAPISEAAAEAATATTPMQSSGARRRAGLGATAAAAVLNTQDVVLAPGEASKVSSPAAEDPRDSSQDSEADKSTGTFSAAGSSEAADSSSSTAADPNDQRAISSRNSTPTPGTMAGARAMTPTETNSTSGFSTLSPTGTEIGDGNAQDYGFNRRASVQLYTGTESGTATPALPIGLTSAPSSAFTPAIPTYGADEQLSGPSTPLTKETNNLKLTLPPTPAPTSASATPTAVSYRSSTGAGTAGSSLSSSTGTVHARGASLTPTGNRMTMTATSQPVPLLPIVVKWRGGGKEVFVTGTFANEWRSKILLRKSATSTGKRPEYSCVLHLAPGTHRLKFIVDDRWRVSRDLSTASDGEGNLTNYIEVAHQGPAHPGPLSAPGEDLLAQPGDEEEKRKKSGLGGHKAVLDLLEEARRAEALQRGDLLDVFGEDKVRHEERWTQDVPPSIIKAQAAEEQYRTELEAYTEQEKSSNKHHHRSSSSGGSSSGDRDAPQSANVPVPPTLPRQLEKVILNSTSAAVLGTVDDNSVLPAPNHAVLHHLTASAIKSGVIATGCTVRYRKKYITTVYYRAAS